MGLKTLIAQWYSSTLPKIRHQQRWVVKESSNERWEWGAHEA
jgi:hypothetical protein